MENIRNILKQIEKKKAIRILYACETGSRAWGFPSPDSDYDIRFIYMHEPAWYLSLSKKKDTIEAMDGDQDVTGWDLRKSLLLLKKSNAALIERFQSPIEYYADADFKLRFKQLIESYYSPTAIFFHHYALAAKFWKDLKDAEAVKLKSYFYLIRSLLSCNWIIGDNSIVPMDIENLMKPIDPIIREKFRGLIKLKSGVDEKYLYQKDKALDDWIANLLQQIEEASKMKLGVSRNNMSLLNDFFLQMVYAKA